MNWRDDPVFAKSRCVFTRERIDDAVVRVAAAVTAALARSEPVVIPVLLGALPFGAALVARLDFDLRLDYAQVSRYRGGVRGGALQWLRTPQVPLRGRTVLLVDDVLDGGDTLHELKRWCADAGAASVLAAVLVRKQSARRTGIDADFAGLDAGTEFLFGYGMDYDERYRHLPEIRALAEENG